MPLPSLLNAWRTTRLVTQWDLSGWHCFLHHTFQEYFAAFALSALSEHEVLELAAHHRFNPYWREVWRFYAGLCRCDARSGGRRLRDLVRCFVQPEDLYGETLFLAAPLCAEFGLSDTSTVLGFDLRERLWANLLRRHRHSMDLVETYRADRAPEDFFKYQESRTNHDPQIVARIRIMVDLDPLHFFQHARSQLEFTNPNNRGSVRHDTAQRAEVVLAILILSCIYHPSALAYQVELIRDEAQNRGLRPSDPPVGPRTPTGRNEGLSQEIAALFPKAVGWLQRSRLVEYLANTRSPEAGGILLQIAHTPFPSADTADLLQLQVRCLVALCDLSDPRAVELARELAADENFRVNYLENACESLSELKVEAAAELLEQWLVDRLVEPDSVAYLKLVSALKEWRERCVPPAVEAELQNPKVAQALRLKLWELVLARTGENGRLRLREKFQTALLQTRLTGADWRELAALAQLAADEGLDLVAEVQALALKAPSHAALDRDRLWGALIKLHADRAHLPVHAQWLEDVAIPKLFRELAKPGSKPRAWIEPFAHCPPRVLQRLAATLSAQGTRVSEALLGELLHCFHRHPSLIPKHLLERAEGSEDDDANRAAAEAYLELDPGRLVAKRTTDANIEELLEETSANSGVLFFADRLYSPSLPGFVPYAVQAPAQV